MMMLTCKKKFKLEPINLGLKFFQKNKENKSDGKYRIMQESLEILLPYLDSTRIIQVPAEFFTGLSENEGRKMTFD